MLGIRGMHVAVQCAERSEEHTSELQSQSNLVCRLLLEKKKKKKKIAIVATHPKKTVTKLQCHTLLAAIILPASVVLPSALLSRLSRAHCTTTSYIDTS